MQQAIDLSRRCTPDDPKRTPKLGVVIEYGGIVLAAAHRGTGARDDDEHAEKIALSQLNESDRNLLSEATVYSTLEPCVFPSRREGHDACSELLIRARVRRVVIGILDPNPTICGRGYSRLQEARIQVEMFPDDLAQQVRQINDRFIVGQQQLGIQIIDPVENHAIETESKYGTFLLTFKCVNEPGADIVFITEKAGQYWPQGGVVRNGDEPNERKVEISYGSFGELVVHAVRVNELGQRFIEYYRKITRENGKRMEVLKAEFKLTDERLKELALVLPSTYPSITLGTLPRGLDSQGSVKVNIVQRANGSGHAREAIRSSGVEQTKKND